MGAPSLRRARAKLSPGRRGLLEGKLILFFRTAYIVPAKWPAANESARRCGEAMWGGDVVYRFGDFTLDTESLELNQCGTPLDLEPQVFSLLTCLIEQRDRGARRSHQGRTDRRGLARADHHRRRPQHPHQRRPPGRRRRRQAAVHDQDLPAPGVPLRRPGCR